LGKLRDNDCRQLSFSDKKKAPPKRLGRASTLIAELLSCVARLF
jgi:hypothetical protein